jgi:hypothetical protein
LLTDCSYLDPVDWSAKDKFEQFNSAFGLHFVLQKIFTGEVKETMSSGSTTTMLDSTGLAGTSLFESDIYSFATPKRDLRKQFEVLHQNLTLSLLSNKELRPYTKVATECLQSVSRNIYKYEPRVLLASYGAVILVTIIALTLGLIAMIHNGVPSDTTFSRIMLTTRNTTLDKLARGQGLGEPTKELLKTKIKFGVVEGHPGFGVKGETLTLRKPKKGVLQ